MELSPAQRKIAFAVIVLVLAGLGFSLLGSRSDPSPPAGSSRPGPSAASPPAATASPAAVGSPGQAAAPAPSGTTGPDIYQWLPFTQPELGAAVRTVTRFAGDYGTFSYSQNAAGYLAPMKELITTQLSQLLAQAYSTPGVASMRASRKQVSAGTAAILSLRSYGPGSFTFVVAITQQITDTQGSSRSTTNYAVTASGSGASWQVGDIELASAGNS
jgi:hypothetical protein